MKKPLFVPRIQFESRPDLPENLEEAARLINALQDQTESLALRAEQMEFTHEQGALVRLNRLIKTKIYFHNPSKKT